jgi:hypothetical protein
MIDCDDDNNDDDNRVSCKSRLWEAEGAMHNEDTRMMWRAETRNTIEARILKLRSARGGHHIYRLP